jgi:cytochrome P450
MMKHASVFINDSAEAGRLLEEMTIKGAIYNAFRYDANIPDLLSSDGEAWEVRRKALYPALNHIHVASEDSITSALLAALTKYSETVEPVDLVGLCTSVAFDAVCDAAFGYQLGAVAGSEDGKRIYKTLCTLHDAQANVGIYANANARKVPPEEIAEAKAFWKGFLNKLLAVIRTDSEQYRSKHGELDTERNFGHALIQLSVTEEAYGDAQLISEIHQIIRHGYETITGTLVWLFYALYRYPKVNYTEFDACYVTSILELIAASDSHLSIHYLLCFFFASTDPRKT